MLDQISTARVETVLWDGTARVLHRDFETRGTVKLSAVGSYRYAAHPDTQVLCVGFAVDSGPVQLWTPGDPVPAEFIEAAPDPNWIVAAHNDAFETAIEQHVLAPRFGWPLIPLERHRCTMAMALAAGLPATAERRGGCARAQQSKGCRRRAADAPNVEAAAGA